MALFEDVGAVAFFNQDARPTAVFDLANPEATLSYANPAFLRLRRDAPGCSAAQSDVEYARFAAWARGSAALYRHEAWSLNWTTYLLHDRWRVATCSHQQQQQQQQPPSIPESANSGFSTIIDWTLHDLPDTSDYVKWFKAFDWAATSLGPMHTWPSMLRSLVVMIMGVPEARLILWGPQRATIYNEACIPLIGQKHPHALGRGPEITFSEFWSDVDPIIAAAEHGKTTKIEKMPLSMTRSGFEEECFFDFVIQPICEADGRVAGVMDSVTERTLITVAERRMSLVMQLGDVSTTADDTDDFWKKMLTVLADRTEDVPFALLYGVDLPPDQHAPDFEMATCVLKGSIGAQLHRHVDVENLSLGQGDATGLVSAFRTAWTTRQPVILTSEDSSLPEFLRAGVSGRAGGVSSEKAVAIPIPSLSGSHLVGVVLIGLSAKRPYDNSYRQFVSLLSDRIAHSFASISIPKEQRLAQAASEEAALEHASLSRQLLKRTQDAERREAKFARLYENAPVGMYLLRSDGSPIYLNEAYSRLTGIAQPETLRYDTQVWRDMIIPEDVPLIEEAWSKSFRDKGPFLVDYRLKRPWHALDEATGTNIEGTTWLRASGFPDVDDQGNVTAVFGWVSDISLQKWSEKLQQKRLDEALEAKLQSERFIDTVSHEIRNPLSAILQSADGILSCLKTLDGQSSEVQAAFDSAQTIIFCTQHQKRIVDDILTFSKLDSNLIGLAPEVVAPHDLLRRALNMFASELHAADIDASSSSQNEALVVCDASRILQILINLLTNAIKFTRGHDRRKIYLTLKSSSQPLQESHFIPRRKFRATSEFGPEWGTGEDIYLLFSVQDTGKGLSQSEMDLLFHRFAQASPRTYSQYGGSGLGLFISKELSELHGGQIGVSSASDQGSTFSFFVRALHHVPQPLPFRRPSTAAPSTYLPLPDVEMGNSDLLVEPSVHSPNELPVPTLGRQIEPKLSNLKQAPSLSATDLSLLVVEDNLINQKVMANQLRLAGCTVYLANHGGEALDFLATSSFASSLTTPTKPLSAILMDVEMPVMDGLTAARKIRDMQEAGVLNGHVPLAAVTANARSSQLSDALDAGMDIVVTKPFRIADIVPKILSLVQGKMVANRDPVYGYVDSGSVSGSMSGSASGSASTPASAPGSASTPASAPATGQS